jgi:hypothetical protein
MDIRVRIQVLADDAPTGVRDIFAGPLANRFWLA